MATGNYDPNARYDNGAHAAGSNGCPQNIAVKPVYQPGLSDTRTPGLASDYALTYANQRCGFHAAGALRNNVGSNVAGAPKSILINVVGADAAHSVGVT